MTITIDGQLLFWMATGSFTTVVALLVAMAHLIVLGIRRELAVIIEKGVECKKSVLEKVHTNHDFVLEKLMGHERRIEKLENS